VKWTFALWAGPTWRKERPTLSLQSALTKNIHHVRLTEGQRKRYIVCFNISPVWSCEVRGGRRATGTGFFSVNLHSIAASFSSISVPWGVRLNLHSIAASFSSISVPWGVRLNLHSIAASFSSISVPWGVRRNLHSIAAHSHLSPSLEVCDSPDQAAHYHILGLFKLGWSQSKEVEILSLWSVRRKFSFRTFGIQPQVNVSKRWRIDISPLTGAVNHRLPVS
jgi:hypothetical protein